ncbi:hypothetical protein UPYG_G00185960 [Umbra pygmaea]|uniref:Uncharacterized protein n=1 Tax=Umbra pygmaea TaxID=75934 RepID=A0ABD0WT76_UMBPY
MAPKLTERHISLPAFSKMRVSLATQVCQLFKPLETAPWYRKPGEGELPCQLHKLGGRLTVQVSE